MAISGILLICGGIFLGACILGLVGLLVYQFSQKDKDNRG